MKRELGTVRPITRLAVFSVSAVLASAAAPAAGAPAPPNVDSRARDSGPVGGAVTAQRDALARSLGDEGIVSTDRVSGAARVIARTDGSLTAAGRDAPEQIALGYVREHAEAFGGLTEPDLAALRLTSRYSSPDGVTHLVYAQTDRGVAAYDNVLLANVTADGRLLNIGGSAVAGLGVASVTPAVSALSALGAARDGTGGAMGTPPRARRSAGPERPTRFAGGDHARLTLFSDGAATRLAWRIQVTGGEGILYEAVVDATTAKLLKRRSLAESVVANASVVENHPGAAAGGGTVTVDLNAVPAWLDRSDGFTKLKGNNAHAYADTDTTQGLSGGDLEIAPNSGTDWIYPMTQFFPAGEPCAPEGCSWNSSLPSTRATNRMQAATQLFYFVNRFRDHLAAAPIGFTHAARGFEFTDADGPNGSGRGGDPVLAETDNYDNPLTPPATSRTNNAVMTTPLDGTSPRLQMFLWAPDPGVPGSRPSRNAADTADIVYHEYAHGLTTRSVGSGVGMDAPQSRAMGEGWSDWYALDHLEAGGRRPDTPDSGDMTFASYLEPGGLRYQAADCSVGPDPACPGTADAGPGGFTLGDMGHVDPKGFQIHSDGEIWLETLWDLRREIGSLDARRLITSGLRLSPNNPSFLEARDAILIADQALGGTHYDTIWQVFAVRGMGYSASTTSSSATSAVEAFDLPPALAHDATTVTDPAPDGDGDGVAEPGETVRLTETLRNLGSVTVNDVLGTLSTSTAGAIVGQPDATWPSIDPQTARPGTPAFQVTIPADASCDTSVALGLDLGTDRGNFTLALKLPVGSVLSPDVPKLIPATAAGVTSKLTFAGSGTVDGLRVRIPRLTHTWVGDLVMTLTSPKGTTVTLMNRPGSGDAGSSGDDFVALVLADHAAVSIEDLPATNPPGGYRGIYRPVQALSVFNGEERQGTWTLNVRDGFAQSDSGTLRSWGLRPSQANCPNSPPATADDSYSVNAGQTLNAGSVLDNDSDPDGDPLTAAAVSGPEHGTLALAASGTFTYVPDAGYRGPDTFGYGASDGIATSRATVRITVANNAPAAAGDSYSVGAGETLNASSVLANDSDADGDSLTAATVTEPAGGTLALAADGRFTYTAAAGFSGTDSFTYAVQDPAGASAVATVAISVTPAPSTPPPPPLPPQPAPSPRTSAALAPAKLEVQRARTRGGRLDLLARITSLASGRVKIRYRSGGVTTSFTVPIKGSTIRLDQKLAAAQRRKSTGIVTLTYDGSATVQSDAVTLRAAPRRALLVRRTALIDAQGRLRVSGTIAARARGVVRVRLAYEAGDGSTAFLDYRAVIKAGSWSLTQILPAAAKSAGGQLSIQYTGYEPAAIRGEQDAKAVSPGG